VLKPNAIRGGVQFVRHVVPAVLKPARTLWNEVIGFFFLCFAVVFGFKTARYALDFAHASTSKTEGAGDELLRLVMAGFCTLLLSWYGVTSFRRARKIARS
jgi:hypothetical protein